MKRNPVFILVFLMALCCDRISVAQRVLIPYVSGRKWGYADTNGRVVIRPKYYHVGCFENGRARVSRERWGDVRTCLIDERGKYIIPPRRQWTGYLYNSLDSAKFNVRNSKRKWGIMDANGREVLPCMNESTHKKPNIDHYWMNPFVYYPYLGRSLMVVRRGGKYGIIDTANRPLLPFIYDAFPDLFYNPYYHKTYFMVKIDGKYAMVDTTGKYIIPPADYISHSSHPGIILVTREGRQLLTDTMGKVVADIPGYMAYPTHPTLDSFVFVTKGQGTYGLMNMKREMVMPCIYPNIRVGHDTIAVSRDSVIADKKVRYTRFYHTHTRQPFSEWLTEEQAYPPKPRPIPVAIEVEPEIKEEQRIKLNGKYVAEVERDGMKWTRTGYVHAGLLYAVQGIAKDYSRFIGVMDTQGQFIIAPRESNAKIVRIKLKDSLLILEGRSRKSYQCVADFGLRPVLGFQEHAIADAFYYNGVFYAIVCRRLGINNASQYSLGYAYSEGLKTNMASLVDTSGQPAPGYRGMTILSWCDSVGHYNEGYESRSIDNYSHLLVRQDSTGKIGILSVTGKVALPQVSFKYSVLNAAGYGICLVQKGQYYDGTRHDVNRIYRDPYRPHDIYGGPYLVDSNNRVLLDSLTVESTTLWRPCTISRDGEAIYPPLIHVTLGNTREGLSNGGDLYMDYKGRGYYGKVPPAE